MNPSFKVTLAMYAGEILLRNGAEAFRVEDTITRILKHYNYKSVETITLTTGIFISIVDENDVATTLVKRIHNRKIDLHKIAEVNSISRQICEDKIEPKEAYKKLEEILNSVTYNDNVLIFAWIISCAGFAYLLNNSLLETAITAFIGLLTGIFAIKKCKKFSRIAYPCCVSAFCAFFSILISSFFDNVSMDNIIISSIMPLLPGVAFVNAIRDSLNGDYICAVARVLDVLLVTMCIVLGVGFSLGIFIYLGGFL